MSNGNQNEIPRIGREDRSPPRSQIDPQIDPQTGAAAPSTTQSLPEHAPHQPLGRIPASPHLVRDSGLWMWIWLIGGALLIAFIIVAVIVVR